MKNWTLGAAAAAAMVTLAPAAHATTYAFVSNVLVDFWSYDGATHSTLADKNNPIMSTTADATFRYTGPLDWVDNSHGTSNLVSAFLNLNDVTNFASPSGKYGNVTDFGNQSMSVSGDSTSAFFAVSGSANLAKGYVSHDDGASMYSGATTLFTSPHETTTITNWFSAPGDKQFLVTYVEGNGAPSVLQIATGVPEASTWAMMLAGFAGLGFAAFRARPKAAALA